MHCANENRTTMTIQDLAQRIGVSPTTISRTMSGRGRISERTRSMVLEQMKELGYTPNLNARRLIEGRSMTIALDWGSGSPDSPLDDVYMAQLVEGILHALKEQGYGLLLTPPGSSELVEHWVRGQAVDGVLLLGGGSQEEDTCLAESVLTLGAPTVVIGHHPLAARPRLGSVVIDLVVGMTEVVRHLVEQGHREIAFVGSRPDGRRLSRPG
jgi:DNA-binding LacI/PurR family transcriptional regulator